jgi:hypothetical protein
MRKFLELKEGDVISEQEWDSIQKEISEFFHKDIADYQYHTTDRISLVTTISFGKVKGPEEYPKTLIITMNNSAATISKHIIAVKKQQLSKKTN